MSAVIEIEKLANKIALAMSKAAEKEFKKFPEAAHIKLDVLYMTALGMSVGFMEAKYPGSLELTFKVAKDFSSHVKDMEKTTEVEA